MANTVEWHGDDMLVAVFQQPWTWVEFSEMVKQMHSIIAQKPRTVHLVIVHQVNFPSGNPLRSFRAVAQDQPANLGQVFIIPKELYSPFQSFMRALAAVMERMNPSMRHLRVVTSLAEARQIIEREAY